MQIKLFYAFIAMNMHCKLRKYTAMLSPNGGD